MYIYHQTSNTRRILVGNKIVDHSDVVGASPIGAAPTTSSFSTWHLASMDWAKRLQDETRYIKVLKICASYIRGLTIYIYISRNMGVCKSLSIYSWLSSHITSPWLNCASLSVTSNVPVRMHSDMRWWRHKVGPRDLEFDPVSFWLQDAHCCGSPGTYWVLVSLGVLQCSIGGKSPEPCTGNKR